jgi:hypothetical protein
MKLHEWQAEQQPQLDEAAISLAARVRVGDIRAALIEIGAPEHLVDCSPVQHSSMSPKMVALTLYSEFLAKRKA